jgi:ethanolamine utilization protein EutP (predicted NTPase)
MGNTSLKHNTLSLSLEKIKEKTFSLLDQYNKSETIVSLKSKLANNKNRSQLKVAFVGQYNAGKSTIISALTNLKDINIHSNVATDKSAEFDWNNIKIIDTPGILAGKVEHHDIATKKTLSDSDLIVYVLTSQLFDDVIFENFIDLAYKQRLKGKMLIAVNKMSMEKGEFDTLKTNYLESIKITFKEKGYDFDFEVVFMDAFDYIEGQEENEKDIMELSNFSEFINSLNHFIDDKGIIQKSFDTPIRIIKEELNEVALHEVDPNFSLVIKKYENRLLKNKNEIVKEVDFLYNDLRDKILTEGYAISSLIGEASQEEFGSRQNKFNEFLENESRITMRKIENVIFEKNKKLGEEIKEIEQNDEIIIYKEKLKNQFSNYQSNENLESSSLSNKVNLLNTLGEQSSKLSQMTGASGSANLLAKSSEISGSQVHTVVYDIGKFIGHNFRPWEAVNIAKNIGNVAKFAGPVLAIIGAGITIHGAYKEEKKIKKIVVSKNKINDSFYKTANEIINQLNSKFQDYVKNNIDSQLDEFDKQKSEIIQKNQTNSDFLRKVTELNSEYIDFIEVVNTK